MRPDPIQRIDTAFFWEACERGEFVVQTCEPCKTLWHPPRPMCPDCHSVEKTTQTLSGKGTVLSWRMVSNLEGAAPPVIGMAVTVDFAKTSGGKAVPVFKAA